MITKQGVLLGRRPAVVAFRPRNACPAIRAKVLWLVAALCLPGACTTDSGPLTGRPLGSICQRDFECATGRCLAYEGGAMCSTLCAPDGSCIGGLVCRDFGPSGKWCMPNTPGTGGATDATGSSGRSDVGGTPPVGSDTGGGVTPPVGQDVATPVDGGGGFDPGGGYDPGGCVPNCGHRQCGDDGCRGSCGTCTGGAQCQNGACVCLSR